MARPSGPAQRLDTVGAEGRLSLDGARLPAALRRPPGPPAAPARPARRPRGGAARRRLRAARDLEHRERAPARGAAGRAVVAEARPPGEARAVERRARRIARSRIPAPDRAPGERARPGRGVRDRRPGRPDAPSRRCPRPHRHTGRPRVLHDRQPRALRRERCGLRAPRSARGDGAAQRASRVGGDAHRRHRRRRGAGPGRPRARPARGRRRRWRRSRWYR